MEMTEDDNLDNIFGTDEEEEGVSLQGHEDEDTLSDNECQRPRKKNCLSLLKIKEVNLRRLSAPRDSGQKVSFHC